MSKRKLVLVAMFGLLLAVALIAAACKGAEGPPGPEGTQGPQGIQGPAGPLPPGVARELNVTLEVSRPANGTHFVAGEAGAVTITLNDQFGAEFSKDDLSTLAIYAYGPQETMETVSAIKLIRASADRSKTPHHYIDLLKATDVEVSGGMFKYAFSPVTDEKPGTYTVAIRVALKGDVTQQLMEVLDFQVGTATVETQIVDGSKCQTCHLGADSGQFYFHHVDPGRSPYGSPSIDSGPVQNCKACHNNEGYAAYNGMPGAPATEDPNITRVPDPIVRRVHGVHMGAHLGHAFNIDPEKGDFADYLHVEFPADVRNCSFCHLDDRYKTKPSRMACGACHDNTWFGTAAEIPPEMAAHDMELHPGGPQKDDSACAVCHQPDTASVAPSITEAHKIDPPAFKHTVEVALSDPANGKNYVGGEAPTVTITIKDAATGAAIDPNTIVEPADAQNVQPNEWRRAYLFVSGPREGTQPVLTAKAHEVGPTASTYAGNDFRVLKDASKMDPRFTRTATSIAYQLDDVEGLESGTYSVWVETMPAAPLGGWALVNFQVGTPTAEKKIATNCTQCHDDTRMHAGYFAVEFNPDICKNCHDYKRQIEGKSGWANSNNGYGAAPLARRVHGVHFGRYLDKPEEVHRTHDYSEVIFPQDVRNCTKCHDSEGSTAWKEKPSRVACLACHDTDKAITHAALQTTDASPAEPYSGDEVETCAVCHGKGKDFSPDKVHNISDPYKPPYPREPAE